MKVREAVNILSELNPDLGLFIALNINTDSFLKGAKIEQHSIITIDGLVSCSSYIAVLPFTSLEIKCPQ